MKALTSKSFAFSSAKDVFVVVEVIGDFVRVSTIHGAHPSPVYTLVDSHSCEGKVTDHSRTIACLKELLSKTKQSQKTRYLVLLDRRLAATVESGVSLLRNEAEKPISESDLENLVSHGVWKIFNRERSTLARIMASAEVQLQLTDAEVTKITLDGHRVINPVGFSAQRVELWCRQRVAVSSFLKELYAVLPEEQIISIEDAVGLLGGLLITKKTPALLLAVVGPFETQLYFVEQSAVRYVDVIEWGSRTLLTAFSKALGVSWEEAQALIDVYTRGAASRRVLKKLEAIISGELATLLRAIEAHRDRSAEPAVYIYSFFDLPPLLCDPKLNRRLKLSSRATQVSADFISKNFGYTLNLNKVSPGEYSHSSLLAALASFRKTTRTDLVSRAAERRARWSHIV